MLSGRDAGAPYCIEQVFLVHRETGLLLGDAAVNEQVPVKDVAVVAGMLVAIRDFARDSFRVRESSELDMIRVGELSVQLAYARRVALVAVMRGVATCTFETRLQNAAWTIEQAHEQALRRFDRSGDDELLEELQRSLDECLTL